MGVSTQTPEAMADSGPGQDHSAGKRRTVDAHRRRDARWPYWIPMAILIAGLALTGALTAVSRTQYLRNEKRLLHLRVRDAGALLSAALTPTQLPLVTAAELADATDGNVAKFRSLVGSDVGAGPGQFASISLWSVSDPRLGPLAVVGIRPKLETSMSLAMAVLTSAGRAPSTSVIGLLSPPQPSLGYVALAPDNDRRFAVYGERPLPADRRSRYQSSSEFAGLNYAVYFGKTERARNLLVTDLKTLPQTGTTATETIPFGTANLTLVMSPRASLEGTLPEDLPWIIAVVGVLLSAVAALVALSLITRRHDAELLAARLALTASENQRLYAEQRSIAQTLQHALLPDRLPELPGTQTSGIYQAGERGVDIGGDWYDVIGIDDQRLLMVVGDVSGRGLKAATTMAELRYAIRAYAMQGDPPDAILSKLSQLLQTSVTGQLATILCVMFDTEERNLSVTSAGHLPPLLIEDGAARFVQSDIGLPVGVDANASYRSATARLGGQGTLLAYTDGLVEHRGESLDEGLSRLREAAAAEAAALPELLARLLSELPASADDVAIVGLRWAL